MIENYSSTSRFDNPMLYGPNNGRNSRFSDSFMNIMFENTSLSNIPAKKKIERFK